MTTDRRDFPTLAVVSAAIDILLCPIGDLYEVLGFMVGDELMTHQLPGAMDAAAPSIIEQHPWIGSLNVPHGDKPALVAMCERIVKEHGERIDLGPVREPSWVPGNALRDLADIAGDRPVIYATWMDSIGEGTQQ